ncbi:MAG: biopolymer transporter ExbD [Bdellovibrionales bacterium]|nr:biopolymer transporter ExbD [Bdellovibrionales bacterium]
MGRKRSLRRFMNTRGQTFKIQITSMVDMFVILLVFLLKSYSTSPVQINPSSKLTLPESNSVKDPEDILKIIISQNAIFIEEQKIMDLKSGKLKEEDLDQTDPQFISKLFKALDNQAKKTRNIAAVNDTVNFDGKILMQADRDLPYAILQKIMYTAMLAGYADMKLAVISKP